MAYNKIGNFPDFPGVTGFFDGNGADEVSEISPIKIRRIHIEAKDCGTGNAVAIDDYKFEGNEYILGAFLRVLEKEVTGTTKTIEIGVETDDVDGFIDGASIAAVGVVAHTCDLKGKILTKGKKLSITAPNALTEFVGDLYILYVEV